MNVSLLSVLLIITQRYHGIDSSVELCSYQTMALKSILQDYSQRQGCDRAFELVAYYLERVNTENHPKIQDALDLYRETFVDFSTDFLKRASC